MSQVKPQQRPTQIPTFSSLEDEAAFWDSHSLGEFEEDLEPVEADVAQPLVHRLTVDLDRERFRSLAAIARQQGLTPTALARHWVLENLDRSVSEQNPDRTPENSALD